MEVEEEEERRRREGERGGLNLFYVGHIGPFISGQICPMYAWTDLSNITLDTFGQLAKSGQWKQ